jgi:DNA-binding MarR family transcriptional regulator
MKFDIHELPTTQMIQELAEQIPELNVEDVKLCLLLMRTSGCIYRKIGSNLANWGVSPGRMWILMALFKNPEGLAPSVFADHMGVTRGTITGLLDGLERDGLIERSENPADRRMYNIRLTPNGHQTIKEILPSHFRCITKILETLTPDEKETMTQLIEKIRTRVVNMD